MGLPLSPPPPQPAAGSSFPAKSPRQPRGRTEQLPPRRPPLPGAGRRLPSCSGAAGRPPAQGHGQEHLGATEQPHRGHWHLPRLRRGLGLNAEPVSRLGLPLPVTRLTPGAGDRDTLG